ncbi:hypothetical protein ACFLU8_05630, partial [Chloroflexota bacterium]
TLSISPASGPIGTTMVISGTGFTASNTYQITFAYATAFSRLIASGTVSSGGELFSHSFMIPEIPGAAYTIRVETFGAVGESRTGTFTITSKIVLDDTSGLVGDEVTVDGTGFTANSGITVYFGNESAGTGTTDANGKFTDAAFIVPESYNGSHTVKAQDASAHYATASFSTKESMTINPTTGASGSPVKVTGAGFKARKPITITFGTLAVATTPPSVTTDDYGSFTAEFPAPVIVKGTYDVNSSDGTNQASASFTVMAGASIGQATGNVGTDIKVSGTGYTVGAKVSITYDGKEETTAVANSNGSFSATFPAPPSEHGIHTIVATDTINPANSKTFSFTMESEAPPIPKPLLPEDGIKAEALAHFDWDDVDDPSGVTFTLQIATDEKQTDDGFAAPSIVLKKEGLTDSEYTMTEEEKLKSVKKESPYYWSVKAIDGASNESEWSAPGSFYIGFQWPELKGWILYVLIGVGAVLFLGLGFWLGRRTSYY